MAGIKLMAHSAMDKNSMFSNSKKLMFLINLILFLKHILAQIDAMFKHDEHMVQKKHAKHHYIEEYLLQNLA